MKKECEHEEIYLGKQKNVGVNTMEIAALNKREPVGEGLGLPCGMEESLSGDKGNRGAKQNKAAREGLELVCGTKGRQSEDNGHCQEYKRNPVVRGSRFENEWD